MIENQSYKLGILFVMASAIAWSTAGLFTRLIPLDSWTLLVWRGVFGGLATLAYIVVSERGKTLQRFRSIGWPGLLFAVVSTIAMICYITSLTLTTVAHVAIIYATVPFLAAGLAFAMLGERPTAGSLFASLAALLGVATMAGLSHEGTMSGDILALLMTVAMAILMVIARLYRSIPVMPAVCVAVFMSSLVSLPFAKHAIPGGQDLVMLAQFGVMNLAIGVIFFVYGSRHLPAIETALISSLDAPLAPIWVWLAFAETPGLATIIGAMIVFAAVVANVLANRQAASLQNGAAVAQPRD